MREFINLLKETNNYLIKFKKLSSLEYIHLQKGESINKKTFYHNRKMILNTIDHINKTLNTLPPHKLLSQKEKDTISFLLQEKRNIIVNIVKQDILIHTYLNKKFHNVEHIKIA